MFMCPSNTPPPPPADSDLTHSNIDSILRARDSPSRLVPTRRKSRTKTRKPKFLSLRLQLSSDQSDPMTHQQQLNLFPLHPENLIHDKDIMHDDHNFAFLFTSHGTATLNGLLEQDSTTTTATTNTTVSEEDSMSPPCLAACPFNEESGSSLVRKAMKRRSEEEGRDGREERWVCYSEVTSYCSATTSESTITTTTSFGLLSLKLDYECILNAWSDKGPLYVPGETPHTVPDFLDHVLPHQAPHVRWGEGGEGKSEKKMTGKMGQREASVLRYKEKRQSRLFSKRIRYEVRKLNAEKRPRMKGRFVKRD